MVFDAATLALPIVNRNAQLLAVLLPGLELAVLQDDQARTLADDVCTALSATMCGDRPAIAKIAKSLGLSPRTMQRRLGELGTTYQDMLDDVRWTSARRLLANTDLEMGEIAFLIGFEEVNSFMRAFHAWEGVRPPQWRAKHDARHQASREKSPRATRPSGDRRRRAARRDG